MEAMSGTADEKLAGVLSVKTVGLGWQIAGLVRHIGVTHHALCTFTTYLLTTGLEYNTGLEFKMLKRAGTGRKVKKAGLDQIIEAQVDRYDTVLKGFVCLINWGTAGQMWYSVERLCVSD